MGTFRDTHNHVPESCSYRSMRTMGVRFETIGVALLQLLYIGVVQPNVLYLPEVLNNCACPMMCTYI